jgi:uncharacterized protein
MMQFFDCNAYFGLPSRRPLAPIPDAESLLGEMDYCGVEKALVWHIAQHDGAPQPGNDLLAKGIRPHPRLNGCWSILPNQAHEYPSPAVFFQQMRENRVAALRAFPISHHFLLNEVVMGDWLEAMDEFRIPLFLSMARGADWNIAYQLMAEFPNLVCAICDHGCWGEDRRFRPLVERYPHLYIDTSQYLLDGGIEAFVTDYGPERMLYGSGFPESYIGGMILALKHACISEEAKTAIAGGNLERILAEVII